MMYRISVRAVQPASQQSHQTYTALVPERMLFKRIGAHSELGLTVMRILGSGDDFRPFAEWNACWSTLEIQELLRAARESWRESVGSQPDGILVLNADLRVQAIDSGGAALVGENPSDILLSQVFSLFEPESHEKIEHRMAESSSKEIQTITASGKSVSVRLTYVNDQVLIGLWTNVALVEDEPYKLPFTTSEAESDWLALHADLAVCQTLRDVISVVAGYAKSIMPQSRGFLAIPMNNEMSVVATWPENLPCLARLRFATSESAVLRSGRPSHTGERSGASEPFLVNHVPISLIPCHAHSSLVGFVGSTGDYQTSLQFAQVLSSHLWRLVK